MRSRKGNILDIPETGFILLSVAITLFVMWIVMTNFGTAITGNNATNITNVVDGYNNWQTKYFNAWDFGVLMIVLLFPLVSFLLARKIPSNTFVMVVTWFIIPMIIILMMMVSNIHGGMMDNVTYAQFINTTKFLKWIMPNLGIYGVIYAFLVLFGLYSKDE